MKTQQVRLYMTFRKCKFISRRVHKGKLNVGSVELEAPEHKHVSNVDGIAYVRPHDLSISRTKQSIDAIRQKYLILTQSEISYM